MSKDKISLKDIKQISPQKLLNLINKAKEHVKKDGVMQEAFKEYGIDIEEIDFIPTFFKTLDVSAKTDHAVVWLNYSLLLDGFDLMDYSYLIHEYLHWLQQTSGTEPTKSSDDGEYLQNPFEQEGFQNQIEYIANQFGEDEAENYVDDLLDHHDIDDEDEKDELKDIFMENV